ncbi:MAG: ABC transporter substrate-binding protein [Chloroflexota bacterium]
MRRRQLLKGIGLGAVAAVSLPLLQACSSAAPASAPAAGQNPAPTSKPASAAKRAEAAKPAAQATTKPAEAAKPAAQAPAAGAPKRGGTFEVVVQNDWTTMDAIYSTSGSGVAGVICGNWIGWEANSQGHWGPVPEMIAEWDTSKADSVTLKLQKGIKFHDGTPWDAKAAKWNLDRAAFDPASGLRSFLGSIDRSKEDPAALEKMKADAPQRFEFSSKAIEVVDDSTIKVNLGAPAPAFITNISAAIEWTNPVSPESYNKQGKDAFARNPVGAGPFRFVEWKSGSHIVLQKNPDYWKKGADGQPLPYLDGIRYRLVIDDSARLLELKSGAAHYMELVQGKDIAGVKADSALSILESQSSGNNYRVIFDSTNPDSPFGKHKELRQAMLYALDREAMAKTLGFGSGSGRKYLLPTSSFAYDPDEKAPYYWFDKAKAEQLIKDVMAKDPSIASGGKIPITFSVIERAVDKAQGEMIKQMADAVGFNTTLEVLERAAWTAKLVKRPGQPGGKFDMASMRNPVKADDPDSQWRTFFHSTGSFNVAHLEDPAWDKLIDTAATTLDQGERIKLYRQADQKSFDDAWYGWLWQQDWNYVFSKKAQNVRESIAGRNEFTEIWLA